MNIFQRIIEPFRWKADRPIYNKTLNRINDWTIKHLHWNIIEIIYAAFLIIVLSDIASIFYHTNYSGNPFFWHASGDHHTWDLLALIGLAIYFIYIKHWSPFKSIFTLYFLVAWLEMLWYYTYIISHIYYGNYFNPAWVLSFQQLSYMIIIIAYIAFAIKFKTYKIPYTMMIITFLFMMFWFTQGFPVTVDYTGYTTFYYDIQTNLLEMLHWFLGIGMIIIDLY